MPAPKLIVIVTVALCSSSVAAGDTFQNTPLPTVDSFQTAFDKNVSFWSDLPYTTMPKPAKPATDDEGEYVVLLRVFIDLYMNKLRLGRCSSPLAEFVASLPTLAGNGQSPRKTHHGLLELLGVILQPSELTSPTSLAPLAAIKIVLDVFGSTLRAALYSHDDLQSWRAASFVEKYVQVMVSCKLPYRVALAVLARDLVLADDNVPTEAQVQKAAADLRRFVVVLDQKPTLADAQDLLSGLHGSKPQFDGIDEMAPHIYLDLLVSGLGRGHAALKELCAGRADEFRNSIRARMAVELEQMLFLLVVSGHVDIISLVIPLVNRLTIYRLGFLPFLALFWHRNRPLMEAAAALNLTPVETSAVLLAIENILDNLMHWQRWLLPKEKVPGQAFFDDIRQLIANRLPGSVKWPEKWPALAPRPS